MKICLVFPRLRPQLHGLWPPLGIIQLGTILSRNGYSIRLIDSSFDSNLDRAISQLHEFEPDVVGVSTLTDLLNNARQILAAAKALGCYTVMGGPHATLQPAESLRDIPELDFVVIGEGETTILELVSSIEHATEASAVHGIAFRRDGKIISTQPREVIQDLDTLPIPNRELLDTFPMYLRGRAMNVFAIRGCPYRCSFCHPTLKLLFGPKIRFRSPSSVVTELTLLHRTYHIRDFFFVDDVFTISKEWLSQLAREMEEAGLCKIVRLSVNSRVDLFDEEVVQILRRLNCYYALFGVESGSQDILDSCKKAITLEQTRQAFQLCRKYNIRTHAYIILGLPGETSVTLQATEEFIDEISPTSLQISIATPLIGTDLHHQFVQAGRLNTSTSECSDYYSRQRDAAPILPDGLSYRELCATRAKILQARRVRVIVRNSIELMRDLIHEKEITKVLFRMKFYNDMKYYWG